MVDKRNGINLFRSLAILFILSLAVSGIILTRSVSADYPPVWTTFKVEPESTMADVGETFEVAVNVYDADDIWCWQVEMYWDPTILAYVSHTFGDFMAGQPEGVAQYAFTDSVGYGIFTISETTIGQHPGKDGDGWLFSIEFEVLDLVEDTMDIDNLWTYWIDSDFTTWGDEEDEMYKENGYFVAPWAEDFNKDGRIDVFDIASVAIFYGEPLVWTRNSSSWTGEWTTPEYAQTSDDLYAETSSDGAIETYSDYGFVTGAWKSVTKVEVGVEVFQEDAGEWVYVRVSGDGGLTYPVTHELKPLGTVDPDTPTWIDVTADLSWTPSKLTDAMFKVEIEYDKSGSSKLVYLDWIPVRVTFRPYADLNNDGSVWIEDLSQVGMHYGQKYL